MEQKNSGGFPDGLDTITQGHAEAERHWQEQQAALQQEDDLRIRMLALDSAARVGQGTLTNSPFTSDQAATDVLNLAGKFDHYLRTGELSGSSD